jgi:hypothetical protein
MLVISSAFRIKDGSDGFFVLAFDFFGIGPEDCQYKFISSPRT